MAQFNNPSLVEHQQAKEEVPFHEKYGDQARALGEEAWYIWYNTRTDLQAQKGGEHMEKIKEDEDYRGDYKQKLEDAWVNADVNKNGKLTREEFQNFLNEYKRIDEQEVGCFNPMPY